MWQLTWGATLLFLAQDLAGPAWLVPFPGAQPQETRSATSVRAQYVAAAGTAEVIEHYRKQIAAAGLTPVVNGDGLGTSIRVSAPECDLLIQVRESAGGTLVRTACSSRAEAPGALPAVTGVPPARNRSPQVMLDAHRERAKTTMQKYDQPVYPPHPKLDIWDESTRPPLEWPAWLVHMPGASRALTVTQRVDKNEKQPYLHSSFTTNAPMTEIHEFYESLFTANGVPPPVTRLSTGQTLGGVIQNKSGSVEANRYVRGNHGAHWSYRVSYNRSYLNAPITVTLTVSTRPDFKNRR